MAQRRNINKDVIKIEPNDFDKVFELKEERKITIDTPTNLNELFIFNNYESIEFNHWILFSNASKLEFEPDKIIRSYQGIGEKFTWQYHMYNGIIYELTYNPKDKSIRFGPLNGFSFLTTDLIYTYKS